MRCIFAIGLSMLLSLSCQKEKSFSICLPPTSPWTEIDFETKKELTYNGVPIEILDRLIQSESSWRKNAESKNLYEHSVGLAQVNLHWLKYFREKYDLRDPWNPHQALDFASRYLFDLYRQTGCWYRAVLAYKCGLGAMHNAPIHIQRISRWVVDGGSEYD